MSCSVFILLESEWLSYRVLLPKTRYLYLRSSLLQLNHLLTNFKLSLRGDTLKGRDTKCLHTNEHLIHTTSGLTNATVLLKVIIYC